MSAVAGPALAGTPGEIRLKWLGEVPYEPTWRAMQAFASTRGAGDADQIWCLTHPPVYTLGANGRREHVLDSGQIPVIAVDRGGQVTYHGPGQLVVYPLLDLARLKCGVRDVVRSLEAAVIDTLGGIGVSAATRCGAPGVYVGEAKLASIGLRVRRHSTFHGLSVNVAMDLAPFQGINPCGYPGLAVTDLAALGVAGTPREFANALLPHLWRGLRLPGEPRWVEPGSP